MALQAKYGSAAPAEVDAGNQWMRIRKRLEALGVQFDATVEDVDLLAAVTDFLEALPDGVRDEVETAAESANAAKARRGESGRAEVIACAARDYDANPTLKRMTSKANVIDDSLRQCGCSLLTKSERTELGG